MILYADVLFLINFSMDFLSLYAAGRLLSRSLSVWRMSAAAGIGALYATAATALSFGGILGAACAALCSLCMTAAAFGVQDLLRTSLAVWGSGALLGGSMTLLSGLFGGTLPGGGYADLIAAAAAFSLGIGRLCRRRMHRGYAQVRIPYGENVYEGRALIDSGDLLCDPLSGAPVVLLCPAAARALAGDEAVGKFAGHIAPDSAARGGVRAVPVRTVGGVRILYGFFCPRLVILRGRERLCRSAVVCVDRDAETYGGAPVLLPAALLS